MLESCSYECTWHNCAITADNIPFSFFWHPQSSSPTYTLIWLCLDQTVHMCVQIMKKQVSETPPSPAPRPPISFALTAITLVQVLGGSSKIAYPANSRVIHSTTGRIKLISDGLCVSDDPHISYFRNMLIGRQIIYVMQSAPASMDNQTVSHAPIRASVRMSAAHLRAALSPILALQRVPLLLHSAVINFFPLLMNVHHATLL